MRRKWQDDQVRHLGRRGLTSADLNPRSGAEIWPALVAAAPALIAGANVAASIYSEDKRRELSNTQFDKNAALQREFAQKGIQWRVEDAKKAGLHPLFALGGSVASASPIPVFDSGAQAMDFSSVGDALSKWMDRKKVEGAVTTTDPDELFTITKPGYNSEGEPVDEVAMVPYETKAKHLNIEKQEAEIELLNARKAEILSNANATAPGSVSYVPDEVAMSQSGDSSHTAGTHPLWTSFTAANGFIISLPSNDASQSLEPLSESKALAALVWGYNVKRYGPTWGIEAKKLFPDIFGGFSLP